MSDWEDKHSVNCYFCGELRDERECSPADNYNGGDGGDICPDCIAKRAVLKNDNCLDGMACPTCWSEGPFLISGTAQFRVTDDGAELSDAPDMNWQGGDTAICQECDHLGTVAEFDWANETISMDKLREILERETSVIAPEDAGNLMKIIIQAARQSPI